MDILFLFPQKKKNQKENSRLVPCSTNGLYKVRATAAEQANAGFRTVTRGLLQQFKRSRLESIVYGSPSSSDSKRLLGEAGQNMVAGARARAFRSLQKQGHERATAGQQSCGPVVLPGLQGKGLCGKRSVLLS